MWGVGAASGPDFRGAIARLLERAGLRTRPAIRAFVANGVLPAGATVTPAVFTRAALVLALGIQFPGETEADATDTGL